MCVNTYTYAYMYALNFTNYYRVVTSYYLHFTFEKTGLRELQKHS